MRPLILLILLMVTHGALSTPGATRSEATTSGINTAEIVTNGWCPDCLQWRVSGVCFWLDCDITGCKIRTSVRVTHWLPEVVVTSYSVESPWSLMGDGVNGTSTSGRSTSDFKNPSQLNFKNVDVVGSPALAIYKLMDKQSPLFCSGSVVPFFPHYKSSLDKIGWQLGLPEIFYPQTYIGSVIGKRFLNDWGGLYPRQGFLSQQDDAKAAAVMAQRAADIVTRKGQPHLYVPATSGKCGRQRCWEPGPAVVNDKKTHQWQMLYPRMEKTCDIFGSSADWSKGLYNNEEKYAWHLWRPWSCCDPKGQTFLYSVNF